MLVRRIVAQNVRRFCKEQVRVEWFMYVDHKGLLYMEDTEPKNYTTCIKDQKFLKYFYRQLQENDTGYHEDYRWLQKCWGEFNYVKANTYPIVFNQIEYNRPPEQSYLLFNGQRLIFNPKLVMLDRNDNLIYDLSRTEFEGNLRYGAFTNEVASFLGGFLEQEKINKNVKAKRSKARRRRRKLTSEEKSIKRQERLDSMDAEQLERHGRKDKQQWQKMQQLIEQYKKEQQQMAIDKELKQYVLQLKEMQKEDSQVYCSDEEYELDDHVMNNYNNYDSYEEDYKEYYEEQEQYEEYEEYQYTLNMDDEPHILQKKY